jgi:hypothetical protein
MNTITVTISDERLFKLQEVATHLNLSVEELVLMGIEDLLTKQKVSLQSNTKDEIKPNGEINSELAEKFYSLASQWQSDVEGMSSTTQMSQHPAYREIISMGTKIVPLLLRELKQNPLYCLKPFLSHSETASCKTFSLMHSCKFLSLATSTLRPSSASRS